MRILVAEDNPICSCLTVHLVRKHGYYVRAVVNGAAALSALEREEFDLVLMDIRMPQMDGLAATRAIRAQEQKTGKHLPIVAVTAHTSSEDRERCLAGGMDDYIIKPLRNCDFVAIVEKLCAAPASLPQFA